MPNGDIITSTHIALLPQQNLPLQARKAHIFPKLTKPLISIGILCDNDCIAVFDEDLVTVYNKHTKLPVLMGKRDPVTTLYMIDMSTQPSISQRSELTTKKFNLLNHATGATLQTTKELNHWSAPIIKLCDDEIVDSGQIDSKDKNYPIGNRTWTPA